jgi:para-nitrobenzyl esterase
MRLTLRVVGVVLLSLAVPACRTAHRAPLTLETKRADTLRHLVSGDVIGGEGRYGAHAWLGIPFAAPPVGPLRWRAPQPVTPWSTPLEALTSKPACPQFASPLGGADDEEGVVGHEDCLGLNVFAPPFEASALPKEGERLPVMVWIHGGGNSIGSASFCDGGHLATAGHVVVVAIQYRLGPLGWFRHAALRDGVADPLEASGNFGTLDQVAALEWVRDNIAAFGGDPGNVTVFGESAGGQDTFALLVSPRAKGLFHRAIAQSGNLSRTSAELAEHFTDDAVPGHKNSSSEILVRALVKEGQAADRAAAKTKAASMPASDVAAFLRARSPVELLHLYAEASPPRVGMIDAPLVIKDGALLPEGDWLETFAKPGGWNEVPVIVGSNRDEMRLFLAFDPTMSWKLFGVLPRLRDEPTYLATAEATSKLWKAVGVDLPLEAMHRSGATALWSYRFDWDDEPTVLGTDLSKLIGAAHGMEVPFVFGHFDLGKLGKQLYTEDRRPDREALSAQMMSYWSTFARTGKPDRGGVAAQAEWTPWDDAPGALNAMVLDRPKGGGVRMAHDIQTPETVQQELFADPRLKDSEARCRVIQRMAAFKWVTEAKAKELCGDSANVN